MVVNKSRTRCVRQCDDYYEGGNDDNDDDNVEGEENIKKLRRSEWNSFKAFRCRG